MRNLDGRKVLQIHISDRLNAEFKQAVPSGEQSDTIRSMMLLYLQNGNFKKQVDSFREEHKTL